MPNRSPITNCWGSARTDRVSTDEVVVHRGEEGGWYNHHQQITSLDGRLFVTFSNGAIHEDSPGQRMMLSVSDDDGRTWSPARPMVDSQAGEFGDAVLTAMGIHVHGTRLVAYCGYYDPTEAGLRVFNAHDRGRESRSPSEAPWHQGTHTQIYSSDDRGNTWQGPVGRIDRFVPNLSPQPVGGGRLIIPGHMWFPYTDDPAGIHGWTPTGLPRLPDSYYDDPEGFWTGRRARGDDHPCCEGSLFQTDDGVIHMMLRTIGDSLAVTESEDNGATWSEPMMTDYSDCDSRHHFGRLPDGRYFGLSCAEPGSNRTPMVLATSDDGVVFDRHYILGDGPAHEPRMPGTAKRGRYGYPSCHIRDDAIYIVNSVSKEDIAVVRIPLDRLAE